MNESKKFSIGDTAFAIVGREVVWGKIEDILYKEGKPPIYIVGTRICNYYKFADQLFHDKEELKSWLEDELTKYE